MDKTLHSMDKSLHSLYYSSLLSESPSIRDSTSRHANRFRNAMEMSSMHLLPSNLINQSLFLNETIANRFDSSALLLDKEDMEEEEGVEDMSSSLTLYQQFFETKQKHSMENVLDLMKELELLCCDHLLVTKNLLKSKVRHSLETNRMKRLENMLRFERNSWRLMRAIFEDRLRNSGTDHEMMDDISAKIDDKTLIERTFERDANLREMQTVVDWLERNQLDDSEELTSDRIQFYSEGPYSWENSLHALKTKAENYATERQLCPHMDPDAPIRTKRPLHDLDVEDESRLFRYVFHLLRAGQLPDAKDICQRLGYHWLSAALDGWLLHCDPNYDNDLGSARVLLPIEGNPNRDLWKHVCWRSSKIEGLNLYERSLFAALSGNVASVLPLCTRWTDKLWAYFKCSLDVHIEYELRRSLAAKPDSKARYSVDLPDAYWDNKLTAAEIFREIESHGSISSVVEEQYHQTVQKFVILGDIESLIDFVYESSRLISELKSEPNEQSLESQVLRFFAHLILVLRALKLSSSRESLCVSVLESYIRFLIDKNQLELVAFYTSELPKRNQITVFAKLLERIEDPNDRQLCILLAKNANLDISSITATVVDNVTTKPSDESLQMSSELMNATNSEDKKKINSLDWLLFNEVQQWSEALKQANALMRTFLLVRKVEAMRETFEKLPETIIDKLYNQWRQRHGSTQLLPEDDNSVREYLCHKAYIQANNAVTDWLYCLHNSKPRAPPKPTSQRFMDTVAHEHSLKQFELELNHWKEMVKSQGRLAVDKIENVLFFPDGGWMADQSDCPSTGDGIRSHQMLELRRQYIPQLVFIIHSIHKSCNNLVECMKIADFVADERRALYKTFSRELLIDLLKKLRETSIEILNESSDPLSYPII